MSVTENEIIVPELNNETIESMIYIVRGEKVMLDFELAQIYGYETRNFNRQINNNIDKFPNEFPFQLTRDEVDRLSRCKNFTSIPIMQTQGIKGGRTSLPRAFIEQGISLFYNQVVRTNSIPFELKANILNKETIVALNEIETMGKIPRNIKDTTVLIA